MVTLVTATLSLRGPAVREFSGVRSLHACFWAGSLICISAAYVLTSVVVEPSDRYLIIAIPAIAAVVPMHVTGRWRGRLVCAGATVFALTSVVALSLDVERGSFNQGTAVRVLGPIEAVVGSEHLGVGYAGYWNAASLTWSSDGHLRVYPITDVAGPAAPMFLARAAAWYVPRPATSSYVVLAPGDGDLADRLPPGLARPQREIRLGAITLATYPDDVARYLARPLTSSG